MKAKTIRMKTLKMLISSKELSSQEEVLKALAKEGFTITQATLSRDLKQLKVAKAASMNGKYVYVLPNETMYKRVSSPQRATDMANSNGFLSLTFSGQLAVMKTRPGYASAVAYDIDQKEIQGVLGSIAGDDTLFIAIEEGFDREKIVEGLSQIIPGIGRVSVVIPGYEDELGEYKSSPPLWLRPATLVKTRNSGSK